MATREESFDIVFGSKDKLSPEMEKISREFAKLAKEADKSDKEVEKLNKKLETLAKSNAANRQLKQFSDLNSTLGKTLNVFGGMGFAVTKTTTAMTTLVAGGVALAVKKFADFQDVMLKNKAILGANEDQYQTLLDLTKRLGAETRYSAAEAAEGLQFLAMAGFDVEKSAKALPGVLQLAAAAAMGLGDAADISTNILTGYGKTAEELEGVNNVLVATFTKSNTSLHELGEGFKYVGPIASQFGIPIETTSAILGKLADSGIKAEMGGTALRNILLTLAAPATNIGKLMEKLGVDTEELGINFADSANALMSLGVNVKDSAGNLRPFTDILRDLQAGLDKIPDSADRTATLMNIFGKRGGPQLAALLQQGAGAIDELEKGIRGAGNIAERVAEEMESGVGGALRRVAAAWEGFLIGIGEKISTMPLDGLQKVFETAIKEIDKGTFDPLFNIINSISDDIGKALADIARKFPEAFKNIDFAKLEKAIEKLKGALVDLFGAKDLSTVDGLRDAIQGILDTINSGINITAGFIEAFTPIVEIISKAARAFGDLSPETQRVIGTLSGAAAILSPVVIGFATLGATIASSKVLFAAVLPILTSISGAAAGLGAAILGPAGLAFALGGLFGTLANQFDAVRDAAQWLIGKIDEMRGKGPLYDYSKDEEAAKIAQEGYQKYLENIKRAQDEVQSRLDVEALEKEYDQLGDMWLEHIAKMKSEMESLDDIPITLDVETETAKNKIKEFYDFTIEENADGLTIEYFGEINQESVDKVDEVKKALEEDVKFQMEMETKLFEAEADRVKTLIEQTGETAREALRLNVELQIANAEANLKKFEASLTATTEVIKSASSAAAELLGLLSMEGVDLYTRSMIEEQLRQEQRIQKESFELQKQMMELELERMRIQNQMMDDMRTGKVSPLRVTIDPSFEPAMDLVLRTFLEKIRLFGIEYGLNQLLEVS